MLRLYSAVQSSMRGLSARLSRLGSAFCFATQLRAKPSITIMSPRLSTLGPGRRCCTVRFVERQERFQRRRNITPLYLISSSTDLVLLARPCEYFLYSC
jgi:hypothetical protein